MLKQLRSEYNHLKNLPMEREKEQEIMSSNSESRRGPNSEVPSSIPSSKPKVSKKREANRNYIQREDRYWLVEKQQY